MRKKAGSIFKKFVKNMRMENDADGDFVYEQEVYEDDIDELDVEGEHDTEPEIEEIEGQLSIDIIDTGDSIIIQAMVAGTRQQDIDISITREQVQIKGSRQPNSKFTRNSYLVQELYWGRFVRNIDLPDEIDVEAADATEEHGLLTIVLPKTNKNKHASLKVRSLY